MLNEDDLRSNRGDRLTRNGPIGNGAGRVHNETTHEDGYVDDYGGFHPDPPERDYAQEAREAEERDRKIREQADRDMEQRRQAEEMRQRQQEAREQQQRLQAEAAAQRQHSNNVILWGLLTGLALGIAAKKDREKNQPREVQPRQAPPAYVYTGTPKPAKKGFQRVHIPKAAYVGIVAVTILLLFGPVVNFLNSFTVPFFQGDGLAEGVVLAAGFAMAAVSAVLCGAVGAGICWLVRKCIGK